MTYEELLIDIDLKGYENVLPKVGKKYFDDKHWFIFIVCDDGDCHLFDKYGKENDISKIKKIYEYMIPKDVKKIIIPNSVTSIGIEAFSCCSGLTNVMIPDSVTNIGRRAFYKCALENITIPNSVTSIGDYMFYGCNKLESVTIPNSITSIGRGAFWGCSKLKTVTIPNSVMSIVGHAFEDCSNLTNIAIDKPVEQVKSMKFYPWGIEDESIIRCN